MHAQPMYVPHYTYEDYCQWEGRWELIDGVVIAMSPLPVPRQQQIGGNLFSLFDKALKHNRTGGCEAYPPIDWLVKDDTVLQPDFLVVCGEVTKKYLDFPPVLVAEILSPSTAIKDRNVKFSIYRLQGVKYYLILDVPNRKIEVYELQDGEYQLVSTTPDSFNFEFPGNCSVTVPFSELWD